jgi:hypothetical protein
MLRDVCKTNSVVEFGDAVSMQEVCKAGTVDLLVKTENGKPVWNSSETLSSETFMCQRFAILLSAIIGS